MDEAILDVDHLSIRLDDQLIVNNLSFHICRNEFFCLVGETGCGKTITSRAIMGLLERKMDVHGTILLDNDSNNLIELTEKEWRKIRGKKIGFIYQQPSLALHPMLTIGNQMLGILKNEKVIKRKEAREEVHQQLLEMNFSNPEVIASAYPWQLSGGMNQRIMIGMSLLRKPRLLIADEPTTGLDTINQQIVIRQLIKFQEKYKMSILLITHDLRLVNQIADTVAVMKNGEIIEVAPLSTIKNNPQQYYTKKLWNMMPDAWNIMMREESYAIRSK
ncbi:ABC transporter ATP-binding protein [Virgibacillus chiguensis]|uniref:Peptide/nickel transport system ATP-binding protein/peptide/nickel transport system ATP-binding protein n=1 Tax=Virgibacillus chiguensis TaxID=411959 RepID=A0A1M5MEC8_9BACI|nr:ABC transporter ATP-binding protein [Virgibacillus chiguensis]SHG75645.1 peptide/nickel transport system ATP-binding protein/peptide/nickel transport system ATP-binding protein [Virgibacillus chiguensis]